jgi:uncharacterized protein (DUF488 family)
MVEKAQCYSIGYANRSFDDFVQILVENGITNLIDIRRYPHSTFEEYNKESLERSLPLNNIIYAHCEGVGGLRDSTYIEYMGTGEFRNSAAQLFEYVKKIGNKGGKVVLMCAEKNPKDCHRRYLAQYLEQMGIRVIHLTETGQMDLSCFS